MSDLKPQGKTLDLRPFNVIFEEQIVDARVHLKRLEMCHKLGTNDLHSTTDHLPTYIEECGVKIKQLLDHQSCLRQSYEKICTTYYIK